MKLQNVITGLSKDNELKKRKKAKQPTQAHFPVFP